MADSPDPSAPALPPSVSPAPAARLEALAAIRERLYRARRVVLTTHLNPDGDGVGSMTALASRLASRGIESTIVTPGPAPPTLEFVYGNLPVFSARDPAASDPLDAADTVAILDTAERSRIGPLAETLDRTGGVLIDHHPPVGEPMVEPAIRDPVACSTGELVLDLLYLDGTPLTRFEADALYVAIVTDTGSFQFSNTTPRAHRIAAALLELGVDPQRMYRELYGTYSARRLTMLQRALERLEVDPESPVAWIALDHELLRDLGPRNEDLEGLVEYPRRLAGIEVAMLFRALAPNRTKVSLRSNGEVDVAAIAQALGGGGHTKAAGVMLELGVEEAVRAVLERVRPAAVEARDERA